VPAKKPRYEPADLAIDATVDALIQFFAQVAEKDETLLRKLRENSSFDISNEQWRFTLPTLHAFLRDNVACFSGITYSHFRKSLHRSPVNSTLSMLRATIVIVENTRKVDHSTYALVWLDTGSNS